MKPILLVESNWFLSMVYGQGSYKASHDLLEFAENGIIEIFFVDICNGEIAKNIEREIHDLTQFWKNLTKRAEDRSVSEKYKKTLLDAAVEIELRVVEIRNSYRKVYEEVKASCRPLPYGVDVIDKAALIRDEHSVLHFFDSLVAASVIDYLDKNPGGDSEKPVIFLQMDSAFSKPKCDERGKPIEKSFKEVLESRGVVVSIDSQGCHEYIQGLLKRNEEKQKV